MRRRSAILALFVVLVSVIFVLTPETKANAAFINIDCNNIPLVRCNVANPVNTVISGSLQAISNGIGDAASWMVGVAGSHILETSDVRNTIRDSGFQDLYQRDMGIALVMLVPLLFAAVIRALMQGSPGDLVKTFAIHLPLAIILGFVAIFIADSIFLGIDSLSGVVLSPLKSQVGEMVTRISFAGATSGFGIILIPVIAIALMLAAFAVLIELIARDVILVATMAFVPMAFVGLVWSVTAGWFERTLRVIASFSLMKLIMAVLLAAGVIVLNGALTKDSFTAQEQNTLDIHVFTSNDGKASSCGTLASSGAPIASIQNQVSSCMVSTLSSTDKLNYESITGPDPVDKTKTTSVAQQLADFCGADLTAAANEQAANPSGSITDYLNKYWGCFEIETGPGTHNQLLIDRINAGGIDTQARLSALLKNGIVGIVLFFVVALSPAIAFRLFDVFEANAEQIRYARRGVGLSPVQRVAGVQTQIQVGDLLTQGKVSRETRSRS